MKKLLLLFLLFSNLVYSGNIVNSWECGDNMVYWYDDNTLQIGGVTYDIENREGKYALTLKEYTFLIVEIKENGNLLILNSSNPSDFRNFTKCK